ncbi:hypothetical protein N658DRAFT_139367 [Parathielavia hyrcaniae]|uniref:Uncharacterized protein n=1 Tax=Parathielavia hyrcaniae TaxID=113614 RepID=A0AAN6Q0M3_9PEZI|nr:hypothetical protein N658DRAFT_139367 [Parathielavia hyrcaniae]
MIAFLPLRREPVIPPRTRTAPAVVSHTTFASTTPNRQERKREGCNFGIFCLLSVSWSWIYPQRAWVKGRTIIHGGMGIGYTGGWGSDALNGLWGLQWLAGVGMIWCCMMFLSHPRDTPDWSCFPAGLYEWDEEDGICMRNS